MAYYLSEFVGDGSELDPFRPPATGPFGIIDLRGDTTVAAGRCLLWTPADLPADSRYEKVADATVESIPRPISQLIENALGVTLDQFDTLQAIIAELLILHGSFTDPGQWNPLRANRFGRHVIHLGGKVYDAPAPVGATITDDFNRADSESLGSSSEGWSWTEVGTSPGLGITTNEAANKVFGFQPNLARAESDLSGDDHYAQIVYQGEHYSNNRLDLVVRWDTATSTYYRGRLTRSPGDDEGIYKVESGSETQIASGTQSVALDSAGGDVCYFEVDGSSLDLLLNSTSEFSVTDTSITGFTRTGFGLQASTEADRCFGDNFEAGDLVTPLYQSVDDDPASPTDSDWVNNAVDVT